MAGRASGKCLECPDELGHDWNESFFRRLFRRQFRNRGGTVHLAKITQVVIRNSARIVPEMTAGLIETAAKICTAHSTGRVSAGPPVRRQINCRRMIALPTWRWVFADPLRDVRNRKACGEVGPGPGARPMDSAPLASGLSLSAVQPAHRPYLWGLGLDDICDGGGTPVQAFRHNGLPDSSASTRTPLTGAKFSGAPTSRSNPV